MSAAPDSITPTQRHPLVVSRTTAMQILDSRGLPTIQVELHLADGTSVLAAAPAGMSTGGREVPELRDHGRPWAGQGVRSAVAAVKGEIADLLASRQWATQGDLDEALCALDGMPTLSRLGGNSLVATSMAAARGFAHADELSLHSWIARELGAGESLPVPYFNVVNGGAHATNSLAFQEFMIVPAGASSAEDAIQCGAEVYRALAAGIRRAYSGTGFGQEGGYTPPVSRPEAALDLIMEAIRSAGYTAGPSTVSIAVDAAANGFYDGELYRLDGMAVTGGELIDYYQHLVDAYPITSVEDGLAENDRRGWAELHQRLGGRIQIAGDDLLATDATRIAAAANDSLANTAIIKPNQAGTLTRAFAAIRAAGTHRMRCIVSHRSGETLDSFIADLAVGSGAGRIKAGAPARGERVAKYNRLLEIEAHNPTLPYGPSTAGPTR